MNMQTALYDYIIESASEIELDSTEHRFGAHFEKRMARLLDKMRGDYYHRLTRKSVRFILIAAILLSIATVALASPAGRSFIIEKFNGYSVYTVYDAEKPNKISDITIGYIPEGFEMTDSSIVEDTSAFYTYENESDWLIIEIEPLNAKYTVDTDNSKTEKITVENEEYLHIFRHEANEYIYNSDKYIYSVSGNIEQCELIKVLQNIE